ncbi:MAG: hypothetical protein ACON4O_03230 [Lentimonas sp.]
MLRVFRWVAPVFIFAFTSLVYGEGSAVVNELSAENSRLGKQRVEQRKWKAPQQSNLLDKSFALKEWDKHFSALGSKRAPISARDSNEKKIFSTETKEYQMKNYEMSRWNERLATLQQNALIQTDQKAAKLAEKQLYYMMLQDNRKYEELGVKLSLRDINKYQFRRNRSDGEIPVSTAGE